MIRSKCYIIFIFIFLIIPKYYAQTENEVNRLNRLFKETIYTNFDTAYDAAKKAVSISKKLNRDDLLLTSYTNLSRIYYKKKKNDSSLVYVKKGLELALKNNDFKKQAILFNHFGVIERMNGNYAEALKLFEKSMHIANMHEYIEQICDNHNSRAFLYKIRGDLVKYSEDLEKAIKIGKANNLKRRLAKSYNSKGLSFFEKEKDSAINYHNRALVLSKELGDLYFQALVLSNLGDLYINMKIYDKAFETLNQSETLTRKIGDKTTLYFINLTLGIHYIEIGNFAEGIKKCEIAINDYGKYVSQNKIARGYWIISEAYYLNEQYKKAFDHQYEYIKLNKELLSAKKAKEFDKIRTKFEVEKKDTQIALLEKKNELDEARRNGIIIISLVITVALLILLLYYRKNIKTQQIIRKKENESLQKEQELIQVKALIEGQDKERYRMAKELHDGLGGQLASVNLSLSQVNSELQNPSIRKIGVKLSNIFRELRILSHNLSANYFNDKGFDSLLLDLKQQYEHVNAFKVNISIFPEESLTTINTDIKHNLYRILQELFNNASKHANCENIEVSINRHSNSIIVMLEDDGIGFNTQTIKQGIGLKNIKERAKSINANLTIDSLQGKGTQITIEIPA